MPPSLDYRLIRRAHYKILLAGIVLAVLFWLLQSILDTWVFEERDLRTGLWPEEGRVLWMRLVIVTLISTLAIYMNRAISRFHHDALQIHGLREHTHDAYLSVDRRWTITFFSARAERLFSRNLSDVAGQSLWTIFPADELCFQSPFKRSAALATDAVFDGYHAAIGKWLEIHTHPDRAGMTIYVRDVSDNKKAIKAVQYVSNFDILTGLPNRHLLLDRLGHALERAKRKKSIIAVLDVNVDRFSDLNNSLGLGRGDELIQTIAHRLQTSVREADTVARRGGDNFTIMLEDIQNKETITHTVTRIMRTLGAPLEVDQHAITITACIGISVYPEHCDRVERLLQYAEVAMRHAKKQGRSMFHYFSEVLNREVLTRIALEQDLTRALANLEFELHYQPQIDLTSGAVIGVEALLRWNHATRGVISPAEFIPLLEDTGLILAVGDWVLTSACRQGMQWLDAGLPPMNIAVNLSPLQFHQPDLALRIEHILEETGFDPSHLELEITEGMLINNIEETVRTLNTLHERGIRVSIDDFGTGYSSLSYLKRFPIDSLKIDRSFVRDIHSDKNSAAIAAAIIAMAHALDLKVTAEGVESMAQLELLRQQRCDYAQGFFIATPKPVAEIEEWLANDRPTDIAVSG